MYAYNRNYQELMPAPDDKASADGAAQANTSVALDPSIRYKVFTFDYLIKHLIDYGEDQGESRVRQIAHWKLRTTENILKSLLKHHMDQVAK